MAPETKIKICEKLEKSSAEAEMKAYLLGKLDALNEAQAGELLGILTEEENLTEEALARKKSEVFKRLMGDMKAFARKSLSADQKNIEEGESVKDKALLEQMENKLNAL